MEIMTTECEARVLSIVRSRKKVHYDERLPARRKNLVEQGRFLNYHHCLSEPVNQVCLSLHNLNLLPQAVTHVESNSLLRNPRIYLYHLLDLGRYERHLLPVGIRRDTWMDPSKDPTTGSKRQRAPLSLKRLACRP